MYSTKEIISLFTDYFKKNEGSNLYKLVSLFSGELERIKETNNLIVEWRDIDKAQGKALDLIGENINQSRGLATDEVYRVLLKSKIARNLSDGTINTIINVIAIALSTDKRSIKIVEGWTDELNPEPASIKLMEMPLEAINRAGIDPANFVRIIQKTVAGGVKVQSIELNGTFEFGDTSLAIDNSKGFADIDGTTGGYLGAAFNPSTDQDLPI
ncbi:DUF2612 domain-containing protein [Rummeliibacillus stabekisii]|uniref:DUF2612 domain-containing protein n=1 Tax=Rummeliibacillus stabekisii TaxID=241244 RepID=A0A143HFZ3_9BACL|nr:DUF2612 domain-containing protein [Rummeliibacillus stabekisii]AMX00406.1 hypothetical protein ATY39_13895 [Rummeliibacillus stabekisii]